MTSPSPLLSVRDLKVTFASREREVYAVNGVSFDVQPGETMVLLGESGSGKSVTLRSLMKLHPPKKTRYSGEIQFDGTSMLTCSERQLRRLRGAEISMIFQEPSTSLDPVYKIGQQISEMIMQHESLSQAAALARAKDLLELVRIPSAAERLNAYPHELSGGMRQRVMIALALSCSPKLLLADEPTTALDATVQIQIILLLKQLQDELGLSIIFVTHDVGVAVEVGTKVAVMYAGQMVEYGEMRDVVRSPQHPYTQGLLNSTVHAGLRGKRLDAIPGAPPNLSSPLDICGFAPRCPHAHKACIQGVPEPRIPMPGHMSRCVLAEDRVSRLA
ncbi:ABC transporter ATP-binding protein [Salinicola sp. 4072]|jgi:peptide/nickel transport system ATP-binding protein|uniref:ABC transporter ATP-binding protein n=1 Tax=Salinicola TaxID=404432 RepID=UPI0026EF4E51|nr:ABC transporter ATP-binding protein [Salinicola salarius]